MNDLVSVVIPTFERPFQLYSAINSVLAQDYKRFEVLVVNDSDEEIPVKDTIERLNDARIKYYQNNRVKGANGARNTGILEAKGEYIAFLDDDDEWMPIKLKRQMEYLRNNPSMCGVFSGYVIRFMGKWRTKKYNISSLKMDDVLLNTVSIGSSSNLLVRSQIFKEIGYWNEDLQRQQDLELLVRILAKQSIGYDDHIGVKIYGHNDPNPRKAISGHLRYYDQVKSYLFSLDPNTQNKFHSYHYRRLAMYSIKLGEYSTAIDHYKKAIRYQWIHPRKDVKNIYHLVNRLANLDS